MADSFSWFLFFFLSVVYKNLLRRLKIIFLSLLIFFFSHLANINLFPVFLMELILIQLYLFIYLFHPLDIGITDDSPWPEYSSQTASGVTGYIWGQWCSSHQPLPNVCTGRPLAYTTWDSRSFLPTPLPWEGCSRTGPGPAHMVPSAWNSSSLLSCFPLGSAQILSFGRKTALISSLRGTPTSQQSNFLMYSIHL